LPIKKFDNGEDILNRAYVDTVLILTCIYTFWTAYVSVCSSNCKCATHIIIFM